MFWRWWNVLRSEAVVSVRETDTLLLLVLLFLTASSKYSSLFPMEWHVLDACWSLVCFCKMVISGLERWLHG